VSLANGTTSPMVQSLRMSFSSHPSSNALSHTQCG
jgi:hypothetical protein